jgi:hypothetical protein
MQTATYPKFTVPAAVKAAGPKVYGMAVLAKFKALQAAELESYCLKGRAAKSPCPCASGTWESDGYAILKAVLKQSSKANMH